jgi:HK97 gp10 family phage protein
MAVKVRGLDRLLRQLEALPNSARVALADALAEGAREMSEKIKAAAPEDDGDLKASVGWTEGPPPEVKSSGVFRFTVKDLGPKGRALNDAGLLFSVYAGDEKAYYARWVEFGTSARDARASTKPGKGVVASWRKRGRKAARAHAATPAQPFFYPTIRAFKKPLKSMVVRRLNRAIKDLASLR